MIGFARLSSKVWRVANAFTPFDSKSSSDNIEYLDYQVLQWQKRIPDSLRYDPSEPESLTAAKKEPLFARALTYARINQIRSLIYRQILYSRSTITQHIIHAQTVVDIAKSTISFLAHLNGTSSVYQSQTVIFSHFLVSALGVLLLAVANAPDDFGNQCGEEYYTALRLLKQSAMESQVCMRLWNTVEGLERLGPILGLALPSPQYQPHIGVVSNAHQAERLPGGNTSMDRSQYIAPELSTSGLRDDLVSLFGFTTDVVDHALFLPQVSCDGSSYVTQLGDDFGSADSTQEEISRYTRGFV